MPISDEQREILNDLSGRRILQIRQENQSLLLGTNVEVERRRGERRQFFTLAVAVGACVKLNQYNLQEDGIHFYPRRHPGVLRVRATGVRMQDYGWQYVEEPEVSTRQEQDFNGVEPMPLKSYKKGGAARVLSQPDTVGSVTIFDRGNNMNVLMEELEHPRVRYPREHPNFHALHDMVETALQATAEWTSPT